MLVGRCQHLLSFESARLNFQELPITSAQSSRPLRAVSAVVLAVVLGGVVAGCSTDPAGKATSSQTSTTSAAAGNATPLWPAPTDASARVAAAGLNLGPMGMVEHYHPQLQIILDGKQVQVAPNIGVDPGTGAMSAVHTHEPDGTIHIEAGTAGENFTLGQLFTEWGVKLSATQIGDLEAKKGQKLTVTSNGTPVAGNPNKLRLQPDQKIVIRLQ